MEKQKERIFNDFGRLVVTRTVAKLSGENKEFKNFVDACLDNRYTNCDWGDLGDEYICINDYAAKNKGRVLASYNFPSDSNFGQDDNRLWITTDWGHCVTTVLFPSEY